jgi:prefoldin subunit 5
VKEGVIKENQQSRREHFNFEVGSLAYQRIKLQKQIEEIDRKITQLEGAITENDNLRRDLGSEEAIQEAQKKEVK